MTMLILRFLDSVLQRVCPSPCVLTVICHVLHRQSDHFIRYGCPFAHNYRFCWPWCLRGISVKHYLCWFGHMFRCWSMPTHRSLFMYHIAHDSSKLSYHGNRRQHQVLHDTLRRHRDHQTQWYWWSPALMECFISRASLNVLIFWHRLSIWYRIRWPVRVSRIFQTLFHNDLVHLDFITLHRSSRRCYMDIAICGPKWLSGWSPHSILNICLQHVPLHSGM